MKYIQSPEGTVYRTDNPSNWIGCKVLTNKEGERLLREQARKQLRDLCPPGTMVYTSLKQVSRSRMSRQIDVFVTEGGSIRDITGLVSIAAGITQGKHGHLVVGGCGMDMGFHVVYSLGRALYPEGFKLAANQYGRNGDKSGFDRDGGYALKQSWI